MAFRNTRKRNPLMYSPPLSLKGQAKATQNSQAKNTPQIQARHNASQDEASAMNQGEANAANGQLNKTFDAHQDRNFSNEGAFPKKKALNMKSQSKVPSQLEKSLSNASSRKTLYAKSLKKQESIKAEINALKLKMLEDELAKEEANGKQILDGHDSSQDELEDELIEIGDDDSQVYAEQKVDNWLNQPNRNEQMEFSTNAVLVQAFKALSFRNTKDLPMFDGDLFQWENFKCEFDRSTRENKINDADNLRRLNKALVGTAKASVNSMLHDPANVSLIMELLETNFAQPDWVIMTLLDKARQLPNVKDGSIESFRSFFNNAIGIVNTMRNVGGEAYLISPELLATFVEKLPQFSRNIWGHHKAQLSRIKKVMTVKDFVDWLADELKAQYASFNPLTNKKATNQPVTTNPPVKQNQRPVQKSFAPVFLNADEENTEQPQQPQQQRGCRICGSTGHKSAENCEEFRKLSVIDRRQRAKDVKLCFNCLTPGHSAGKRCPKHGTKCSKCNYGHHDLVHKDMETKPNSQQVMPSESQNHLDETETNCTNVAAKNCLLRLAKVKLRGPLGDVETTALFDEGSTASMIDKALAETMSLKGKSSPITYKWTNSITHHEPDSQIVDLEITGTGKKFYWLKNVRTSSQLDLPAQKLDLKSIAERYPNLDMELLTSIKDAKPQLLVGSNNARLITPLEACELKREGLIMTRCRLGWTVHGTIIETLGSQMPEIDVFFHGVSNADDDVLSEQAELTRLIKMQYQLENLGAPEKDKLSQEDERALEIMKSTIRKVNDHFEIGQLYKFPDMPMPTQASKAMAKKRLLFIERRMNQSPEFAQAYIDKIDDYITKGYARKLQGDELKVTPKTYYLPHFGVYNPNKPGKFRMVMDAKAKCGRYSLNDLLLRGPDFVPHLVAVIWRARLKKVAYMADICEMFHQVKIRADDQESQRFLFRGMARNCEPSEYIMEAMIFGSVSSPSLAQFVKNENAKQLEPKYPGVLRPITKQHYVDDFYDSADTVKEAIDMLKKVDLVHQNGGFVLMKIVSNYTAVQAAFDIDRQAETSNTEYQKPLGILWNTEKDTFNLMLDFPKFEGIEKGSAPTMRRLLSFMMSIFDPLGIMLPLTVKLKILYQDLWRIENRWEQPIPDGVFERFKNWCDEARKLVKVEFPRWYFPGSQPYTEVEMFTFCDASDKAMACSTYIRLLQGNAIYVAFVQGKSKVAPLKHQTVPRLELQAAVMGCEQASLIEKELGVAVTKRRFFTDSRCVLSWISTSEKLSAFIGARVTKILDLSSVSEWQWIQSELNVADMATKEFDDVNLRIDSPWLIGPQFLYKPESQWPHVVNTKLTDEETVSFHEELTFVNSFEDIPEFQLLPKVENYSKLYPLIRTTINTLKAILIFRAKLASIRKQKSTAMPSFVELKNDAEMLWIRHAQHQHFKQEIADLNKTGVVKKSSSIYRLIPFLHQGIIRMKTRSNDESMSYDERNPIILPKNHKFVLLMIDQYHRSNHHQGVDTVINNLMQRFRIINARVVVKKVFHNCNFCKLRKAQPGIVQMGYLPNDRLQSHVFPFTYCGCDHLGPFFIAENRKTLKVWLILFTCFQTRAIHVELVDHLDTSTTIMAIQRFSNLRGKPKKMYSDNGTSFVGADNELKAFLLSLDHPHIASELAIKEGIEWVFNPPAASHFGGVWERMVGSVKTSLKAALNDKKPTRVVLLTVLSDVVNTINNRPLVEIPVDPSESCALTPNGLILGRNNHTHYGVQFDESLALQRNNWKAAQAYSDQWWRKWIRCYRPHIIQQTKWFDSSKDQELKQGDVVYIVDENLPRGSWLKGIIERTYPGKDGRVRVVDVKTTTSTYKRPASKIAKLKFSQGVEDVAA